MDRFEALEIFRAVAEHQSFTRAAEALYLQRSTLSTQIKALEQRLQVQLLYRTTRRVSLTPEGQRFYQHCLQVLEALDTAEHLFQGDHQGVRGRLRVDMTLSLAERVVIPALPDFLAAYPDLQVELSTTDRHLDLIQAGIDCAIRAGQGQESGLASQLLGTMPLINCVSPDYAARYGVPQRPEDLSRHYLVNYVQSFGSVPEAFEYWDGERYCEVKMPHLITVDSVGAYKRACMAGLGLCQIPLMGVRSELQAGQLIEVLPAYRAQPMPLRWVFPYVQTLPQRVQVFMDWFEPLLRKHQEV